MSDDLRDLYQEVILDHGRHPRNKRALAQANHLAHGENPLCGDKLTVFVKLDDQGVIADVSFEGQGCAISTASASLMTEAVKGKSRAEALALFERVHRMLTDDAAPADELGKLAALSGVREYPARVKCASLCWHTLASALQAPDPRALTAVSTE